MQYVCLHIFKYFLLFLLWCGSFRTPCWLSEPFIINRLHLLFIYNICFIYIFLPFFELLINNYWLDQSVWNVTSSVKTVTSEWVWTLFLQISLKRLSSFRWWQSVGLFSKLCPEHTTEHLFLFAALYFENIEALPKWIYWLNPITVSNIFGQALR